MGSVSNILRITILTFDDNQIAEIDSAYVEEIDTTYVDTIYIELEDTAIFDTTIVSIEPSYYLQHRIINRINLNLSKVDVCTLMMCAASGKENPCGSKKTTVPPTPLGLFYR